MIPSSNEQFVAAGSSFEITCRGRKPQLLTDQTISTSRMRLLWVWLPEKPINGQNNISLSQNNLPPGSLFYYFFGLFGTSHCRESTIFYFNYVKQ